MPTVLRVGPCWFRFFASDRPEPPHVHALGAGAEAKFWLQPVRLERSRRFNRRQLRELERIIIEHEETLLEAWHEHFKGN